MTATAEAVVPVERRCGDCAGLVGPVVYCEECSSHEGCFDPDQAPFGDDGRMIEWAERQRLLFGMPAETWDLFMQCAKDLGSG